VIEQGVGAAPFGFGSKRVRVLRFLLLPLAAGLFFSREVEIATPGMPLQGIAHGRRSGSRRSQNPHPYKPKGAAPTVTSAAYKGSCVNDILTRCPMNQENSLRHPPEMETMKRLALAFFMFGQFLTLTPLPMVSSQP